MRFGLVCMAMQADLSAPPNDVRDLGPELAEAGVCP